MVYFSRMMRKKKQKAKRIGFNYVYVEIEMRGKRGSYNGQSVVNHGP